MSKNKIPLSGIIYSTDPGFKPEYEQEQSLITLEPAQQKLRIRLDTKHRVAKLFPLLKVLLEPMKIKRLLEKN